MSNRVRNSLFRVSFFGLIEAGLICVALFSVAGYFSTLHRFLELTAHFKVQYMILALIASVIFAIARRWQWAVAGLLCVLLNLAVILPLYIPRTSVDKQLKASTVANLKLLLSNVNTANRNFGALIDLVNDEKPDVLFVQEVDGLWIKNLEPLRAAYPFTKEVARSDNFGLAIFSRLPLDEAEVMFLSRAEIPSIAAKVKVGGATLSLLTMHPPPPTRADMFQIRNEHFTHASAYMREQTKSAVLIGDFNTSVWSPYFGRLIGGSGLVNARQGFGVVPTWTTANRFKLLMIPIDHCLVTPDINVVEMRTGADIGSDHLPVIVVIGILLPRE